jgi:hypothetical protein
MGGAASLQDLAGRQHALTGLAASISPHDAPFAATNHAACRYDGGEVVQTLAAGEKAGYGGGAVGDGRSRPPEKTSEAVLENFFFFREKETEEIRQMDDEEIIIAGGAHPRSLCWLASVRWKDTWRPGNQENAGVAIPRGIGSIFL